MAVGAELLFVYGSLRQGFTNRYARRLHGGSVYLGAARMAGRVERVGRYPGMKLGGEEFVAGEVFEVMEAGVLEALDLYEGADYRRVRGTARLGSGEQVECWVYEWVAA